MRASAIFGLAALALLAAGCEDSTQNTTATVTPAEPVQTPVERGRYLVAFGGCIDCHTPGYFMGMPDMTRLLGGSEVGFEIPGLGVFHGPNLTPDMETGLGSWTEEQIVTAVTKGMRPDGRELAPIMPWRGFANLTRTDSMAIAAFLKSLPPVSNKVPGPFAQGATPTSFVMRIIPPPGGAPARP